jgi:hypothetical protein
MRIRSPVISGVVICCCCVPLLSGCLGDGSASSASPPIGSSPVVPQPPTLRIQIRETADNGNRGTLIRSWTLGCSPPGGTKPQPDVACRALRDYVSNYTAPIGSCGCAAVRLGTPWAVIKGTLDGKPFRAALTTCMCGFSKRLVRDLYIATSLRDEFHF